MSNYTQTTDFSAKDSLASGDANKIITGASVDVEFAAISTAIATKADDNAVVHLAGVETITGAKTFGAMVTFKKGADVASAATIDLSAATGNLLIVTGTTATSAVTMVSGQIVRCIAAAAWPLTYHATNNRINTGGSNHTLAAGDQVVYHYDGTTVRGYISKADGTAVGTGFATQAEQEAASSTTVAVPPGRQQYHPSAAKAWVSFNAAGGTPSINGSYNVTSITDNGVGDYTVNWTTAFSTANYAWAGSVKTTSAAQQMSVCLKEGTSQATTSITIKVYAGAGSASDADYVNVIAFGDQ